MYHCRSGSSQGDPDEGQESNHQSDQVEIVYGAMHLTMISMAGFGIRETLNKFQSNIYALIWLYFYSVVIICKGSFFCGFGRDHYGRCGIEVRKLFHSLCSDSEAWAPGPRSKKLPRLSKPADDRRGRRIRGEVWAYPSGGLWSGVPLSFGEIHRGCCTLFCHILAFCIIGASLNRLDMLR